MAAEFLAVARILQAESCFWKMIACGIYQSCADRLWEILLKRKVSLSLLLLHLFLAPSGRAQDGFLGRYRAVFNTSCNDVWTLSPGISVPALRNFTVCIYLKLYYPQNSWTAFVYNKELDTNLSTSDQYELGLKGGRDTLTVWIFGKEITWTEKLDENTWHQVCMSWKSEQQEVSVYINNEEKKSEKIPKTGPLLANGQLLLGCSQDPGTSSSSPDGMVGELYMFRMWANGDINQTQNCQDGTIIRWRRDNWVYNKTARPNKSLPCANAANVSSKFGKAQVSTPDSSSIEEMNSLGTVLHNNMCNLSVLCKDTVIYMGTVKFQSDENSSDTSYNLTLKFSSNSDHYQLKAASTPQLELKISDFNKTLQRLTEFSFMQCGAGNQSTSDCNFTIKLPKIMNISNILSNFKEKAEIAPFESCCCPTLHSYSCPSTVDELRLLQCSMPEPTACFGSRTPMPAISPVTSSPVVTQHDAPFSETTTASPSRLTELATTDLANEFYNWPISPAPSNPTPANPPSVSFKTTNPVFPTKSTINTTHTDLPSTSFETTNPVFPTSSMNTTHTDLPSTSFETTNPVFPTPSINTTHTDLPSTSFETMNPVFPTSSINTTHTDLPSTSFETTNPVFPTPSINTTHTDLPSTSFETTNPVFSTSSSNTNHTDLPSTSFKTTNPVFTTIPSTRPTSSSLTMFSTTPATAVLHTTSSDNPTTAPDILPTSSAIYSSSDKHSTTDETGTPSSTSTEPPHHSHTAIISTHAQNVDNIVSQLEGNLTSETITPALGRSMLDTVSELLNMPHSQISKSSKRIIKIVDAIGLKLNFSTKSINLTSPALALAALKVNSSSFSSVSFAVKDSSDLQVFLGTQAPTNSVGAITLPSSIMTNLSSEDKRQASRIIFNFFEKTSLFQDPSLNATLISHVISSSVANLTISNLKTNVTVTLQNVKTKQKQENLTVRCAFWDFSKNGGQGGWSFEGCEVKERRKNETVCSCNHLTSFAVLLDLSRNIAISPIQVLILTFITYIGCGLSAIFLSVTLVTYIAFEKIRRDYPSKILIQLCVALLLLNLVFLLDSWIALYKIGSLCISVAVFLHYFLLVSFTWMGLEAFHMYLALVKVFNTYVRKYILKFCIVGWGVPAVIVAIVLAISPHNYGSGSYGKFPNGSSDEFCWINNNIIFYITVVGYFCIIFLLNISMFIVVLIQLCRIKKKKQLGTQRKTSIQDLRSVAGLTFLLGITWGFAFFAWGPVNLIFMYLFAIFNTLQGFFIFIFYCVAKENVRKQWRRYLCCGKYRLAENSDWSRTATNGLKKQNVNQGVSSSSHSLQSNSNSTNSTSMLMNNDYSVHANGNGNISSEKNGVSFNVQNGDVRLPDFSAKQLIFQENNDTCHKKSCISLRRTSKKGTLQFIEPM
ncbi:adhesion G-protein coupled receptor G2 [Elgaria multicarinata webbii]|uniref:adhesion G-protein coupled receptor G2 n=1 Tax=Elgaria multicarinata webbii TaxID=159646 RepID=UPI002FCD4CC3